MKICVVTTVAMTMKAFVCPSAEYLHREGGFSVTLACNDDGTMSGRVTGWGSFVPIAMTRGVSLDGLRATRDLYRLFRREAFDVVQFSTPNAALYASVAAVIARVPVRVYGQWGIRYVGMTGVRRFVFRLVERLICSLATHVEPDSVGNLDFSVDEGLYRREKGSVLWNGSSCGVDLARFDLAKKVAWRAETRTKYGFADDDFVFGFVGRLCRDKGGNELLAAARAFLDTRPDGRLLLVGTRVDAELSPELAEWSGSDSRVVVVDQTDRVERLFAALDVLCLPTYREGLPTVVVEAEAMGVPVIVTDIPGALDAVLPQRTGMVVPVRQWRPLFDALTRLASDRELCARYGAAGVQFIRSNFDAAVFRAKLLDRRAAQVEEARHARVGGVRR